MATYFDEDGYSDANLEIELSLDLSVRINRDDLPFPAYFYFKDAKQLDRFIAALQKAREEMK